jgi:hypothetical protein
MNRLQVGDECYVRDSETNRIHKCKFGLKCGSKNHKWCDLENEFHNKDGTTLVSLSISKKYKNHIVYPFPCVKELAI